MPHRVAFITGAGSGIGRAVALALAGDGFYLALVSRTRTHLEATVEAITDAGIESPVQPVVADVTNADAVANAVRSALAAWGHIDLLFNNAGVLERGTLEFSPDDFRKLVDTNLTGAFNVLRAVAPAMKQRGAGHIVNLASRSGKIGFPGIGGYAASKFGLVGLSESLYRELAAHGVKVTTLCPSWVNTPMARRQADKWGAEELIQPDDIIRTLRWLLSLSPAACVREVVIECRRGIE